MNNKKVFDLGIYLHLMFSLNVFRDQETGNDNNRDEGVKNAAHG